MHNEYKMLVSSYSVHHSMSSVQRTFYYNHVQPVSCTIIIIILSIITNTSFLTVDPEDLRKLSTILSALATEKQKASKVRLLVLVGRDNLTMLLLTCRLLIRQRVKKVKVLLLARVPGGWTQINMMITQEMNLKILCNSILSTVII